MSKSQSQSQTKKFPIQNFVIIIVAFLLIGLMFGPNAGQVYTGISATGSDTVELTNNGNLDTKIRDFSLSVLQGVGFSGGAVTTDGLYTVHTFTSNGTFTPTSVLDVEVLVVGGGGAGGDAISEGSGNGGGGAGGLLHDNAYPVTAQPYSVTVGMGGNGLSDTSGQNGGNSVFGTLTAIGGGSGNSGNGGSGAGGRYSQSGGTGTAGQGNDGGDGFGSPSYSGGGGAGAGGDGDDADVSGAGDGGIGLLYDISGMSLYYAPGGAGGADGSFSVGTGGNGIGGDGGNKAGTDPTNGMDGRGAGGGGSGSVQAAGGDGGDGVVIIRYITPNQDVIHPTVSVGDDKLHYDDTLSSMLVYSDGSAYIGTSDVTATMKGSIPIIKVGMTQNIKVDHDLEYSITYVPKNMDITSPDMFRADEDMRIDTRLTDTSGNHVSNQPLEMRARLFDSNDDRYLDEIISSTSFVIPGKYIKSGKHYQLRLSYNGFEFGGWSNEILADFDVGTEGFTITSSPDKAPEGLGAASFAAVSNLVGMAVTGWLDIPIIGDIIKFIADLTGVTL